LERRGRGIEESGSMTRLSCRKGRGEEGGVKMTKKKKKKKKKRRSEVLLSI
jgi:hypothetical protein